MICGVSLKKDNDVHLRHAKEILNSNGYIISSEADLNNGNGTKLTCKTGEIVCVYNTGKIVAQGKNQPRIRTLFGLDTLTAGKTDGPAQLQERGVFVVYGHDEHARKELEAMLRRWGLQPKILDQMTSGGQTIIEKLEAAISDVSFAVVLATPDDIGHRVDHPEERAHRARQNVVLELGMMLTKLGRSRVAILMKQQDDMERPSDIQGLVYIPFKDSVRDANLALAKEINSAGINIDLEKI